jgi:hypothetical protein
VDLCMCVIYNVLMCVFVGFLMCVFLWMCFVMCVCVSFVICVYMCGFCNVQAFMCVFLVCFIYISCVLHHKIGTTSSLTILMYKTFLHILGYYISINIQVSQMGLNYQIFWKIYNVCLSGYFCWLASLLIWKLLS